MTGRWLWIAVWLLFTVRVAAEPSGASTPSPTLVVQVVGAGLPKLEQSLRESLGRLAVAVRLTRSAHTRLDEPTTPGAVARAWIEVSESGEVSVLVLDERAGRVLEQRRLAAASEEVLEEQLTLLIRSALETGLGIPREAPSSVRAFAEVQPSPPKPESKPEPKPTPSVEPTAWARPERAFGALESARDLTWDRGTGTPDEQAVSARGWALGIEPSASVRWWSPDLPARRVVALSAEVVQRGLVLSPGVRLSLGYYESASRDDSRLSFDLETYELALLGRASLVEGKNWEWVVASGPNLEWGQGNVRATAPGYAALQPQVHWDLVWRAETGVRWWLQERLALGASVSLDYDASPAAYGVSEQGVERTLAREGRWRPALTVSLGTELGSGR